MGEGGYRQINKTLNICAFDDYLVAQQAVLPKLADVEQLSPRVIRILGQNPGKFTLQGTNTYIVGTGKKRLIIDTAQGFKEWAYLVDETLNTSQLSLSHVILTHWHGDHTGGVPDLLRMYPHLERFIFKNSPEPDQRPINDGDSIGVEGATIRAVHAPGHSHDHMCFILEEENAMFTGDNVLGHGTSAVEYLSVYLDMLRNLQTYNCSVGYPAHGALISNLPAKISGEIAQKERRERQCLDALKKLKRMNGQRTGGLGVNVDELVVLIYGDQIDSTMREMALKPFVEEVLKKLAEDGKVGFRISKGMRTWFHVSDD